MPNTLQGVETFVSLGTATVTAGGTTAPAAGTVENWTLSASNLPGANSTSTPPTGFYIADTAKPTEVILVTNISGATATVVRGADGTAPTAHVLNFTVQQVIGGASGRALQPVNLNLVTQFGADNTGSTDIHAALAAAFSALPSTGGDILLPPGTYKLASTWTANLATTQTVRLVGMGGPQAVTINYTGTGDAIRMYCGSFGSGTDPAWGSGVMNFYLNGTSSASNGLHMGDIGEMVIDNVFVENFTGAGAYGVLLDNEFGWTEQGHYRITVANCTSLVGLSIQNVATAHDSFGYSDFDLTLFPAGGTSTQAGFSVTNGAYLYASHIKIRGDVGSSSSSPAAKTAVLNVWGTAPGSSFNAGNQAQILVSELDVSVESTGGLAFAPQSVYMDANGFIINCFGRLNFGDGWGPFTGATGNFFSYNGLIIGESTLNPSNSPGTVGVGVGIIDTAGPAITGATGTADQNFLTGATIPNPIPAPGSSGNSTYVFEFEAMYVPAGTIGSTTVFGVSASANLGGTTVSCALAGVCYGITSSAAAGTSNSVTAYGDIITSPTHASAAASIVKISGTVVFGGSGPKSGVALTPYFRNTTSADTINVLTSRLYVRPVQL